MDLQFVENLSLTRRSPRRTRIVTGRSVRLERGRPRSKKEGALFGGARWNQKLESNLRRAGLTDHRTTLDVEDDHIAQVQ